MERGQAVKVVGASGQISLGKKYAGHTVLIENIQEGVWLLKLAKVIPDSELWMHDEAKNTRSIRQFHGPLRIRLRKPIWRV